MSVSVRIDVRVEWRDVSEDVNHDGGRKRGHRVVLY